MPNKSRRNNLALVALALISAGCATVYNPATGKNELVMIDTAQEVSLGQGMDAKVRKQMKLSDDPGMRRRLETIGQRLALYSDRKDIAYHFTVVTDKELNAFAIPGGYIYVHSALIQQATDDELAGVAAHEMGHIVARHSVKQLQATMGYQMLISIATGIAGQPYLNQATNTVFNLINLGYSRTDEYQADKLAVRYARRAGYNPYGIVTFFQKLQKEAQNKGGDRTIPFLSSHPPTKDRIQRVLDEIKLNPY
jgi:beta-barrel assembly-enhancing protease